MKMTMLKNRLNDLDSIVSQNSPHEAITIVHKLTIKNVLPLLKIAKNIKQTISHELQN